MAVLLRVGLDGQAPVKTDEEIRNLRNDLVDLDRQVADDAGT